MMTSLSAHCQQQLHLPSPPPVAIHWGIMCALKYKYLNLLSTKSESTPMKTLPIWCELSGKSCRRKCFLKANHFNQLQNHQLQHQPNHRVSPPPPPPVAATCQ